MLIWSRDAFIAALALSLLHSLWQGTILGLLGAALNARLQRATPDVRCGAFSVLLLAVFTVWLGTFCCLYGAGIQSAPLAAQASSATAPVIVSVSNVPTAMSGMIALTQPLYPALVGLWALGICLFSLRYLGGFLLLRRLSRTATAACPPEWTAQAQRLSKLMGIRRNVVLRCSSQIDVPCVFGVFRSCILLPLSAMSGLTPQQAEALIAHELAHLARHDVLFNFIQVCIETALFYHPAVRWLSAQIRVAREQHCDDLAIQFIGDRAVYARALFSLEEARATTPLLALGAKGDNSTAPDTQLVQRIRRVLGVSGPERRDPWARGVMVLGAAAVGLAALHPIQAYSHGKRATSVPAAPSETAKAASKAHPKLAKIFTLSETKNIRADHTFDAYIRISDRKTSVFDVTTQHPQKLKTQELSFMTAPSTQSRLKVIADAAALLNRTPLIGKKGYSIDLPPAKPSQPTQTETVWRQKITTNQAIPATSVDSEPSMSADIAIDGEQGPSDAPSAPSRHVTAIRLPDGVEKLASILSASKTDLPIIAAPNVRISAEITNTLVRSSGMPLIDPQMRGRIERAFPTSSNVTMLMVFSSALTPDTAVELNGKKVRYGDLDPDLQKMLKHELQSIPVKIQAAHTPA
jgi:beta-lactamase regulating signal transducer with metallopeptidase domain